MDMSQNDIGDEGRWMTYGELATARGIDRASAMRLARRNRWRKQKDNQGNLRVLVPLEHQKDLSEDTDRDASSDMSRDMARDDPRVTIAVLRTALETLREQLAREQRRADAAEAEARELRVTAAELDALKARIFTAEASIAEAHRLRLLTPRPSPVADLLAGVAELFMSLGGKRRWHR